MAPGVRLAAGVALAALPAPLLLTAHRLYIILYYIVHKYTFKYAGNCCLTHLRPHC